MALVETGPDAGQLWHCGDPYAEQRAMESGRGTVELANREVLTISGPDRLTWLHDLSSQAFRGLGEDAPVEALILSPTGHIEFGFSGVDHDGTFWAWTEPGVSDALVTWLGSMRFLLRVEVERRPGLRPVWVGAREARPPGVARRSLIGDGVEVLTSDAVTPTAGSWAWHALRIAAGVPRIGVDTDAKTIPNEIGLFGTQLDKGCYRGQETVARVHTLGRPPRRLTRLHLDGSDSTLPSHGERILDWSFPDEARPVGRLGSAERHHELGPIGLALVKRNVPLAHTLVVGGVAASQEALVDPEVGLHVRPELRPGPRP